MAQEKKPTLRIPSDAKITAPPKGRGILSDVHLRQIEDMVTGVGPGTLARGIDPDYLGAVLRKMLSSVRRPSQVLRSGIDNADGYHVDADVPGFVRGLRSADNLDQESTAESIDRMFGMVGRRRPPLGKKLDGINEVIDKGMGPQGGSAVDAIVNDLARYFTGPKFDPFGPTPAKDLTLDQIFDSIQAWKFIGPKGK